MASSGPQVDDTPVSGTERAVLGIESVASIRTFLHAYCVDRLGSGIDGVLFRSGRIDVVWGLRLADGREVVVKVHRPPVDAAAVVAARDAQRILLASDFPCPEPLSGPDEVRDQGRRHLLTAETLLDGDPVDGRDPHERRLLAEGLARSVDILRSASEVSASDLAARVGPGPSWCRYQQGPWPVPHDPIVDFRITPPGWEWVDDCARRAADQILRHRTGLPVVVGHADWYAGNAAVRDGRLVATYDWELIADAEAVVAGFAAAAFAASATSGGGTSSPAAVCAFLRDYEDARGAAFGADEQRAAAGAATWILAFDARWQLGLGNEDPDGTTSLGILRGREQEFLDLAW